MTPQSAERQRLSEYQQRESNWKNWGPYLSERAWGTVREDYSEDGEAWDHFPHDQARSRTYRWNEDGIRSISRYHERNPYRLEVGGQTFEVKYWPAESRSGLFGGNSNWRGPIWFPISYLIIEGLHRFHHYYGDDLKIECPTGSGRMMTLVEVAQELSGRLTRIFLRDGNRRRPVFGGIAKFQDDPHWRDYILFHEYFHGDNGAGLGASHQTGWTGMVAELIQRAW